MRQGYITCDEKLSDFLNTVGQSAEFDRLFANYGLTVSTARCVGRVFNIVLQSGVAITVLDVFTQADISFKVQNEIPRIMEFGFVNSGVIEMSVRGQRREFDALAGQNYAVWAEGDIDAQAIVPGGQHIQLLELRFRPEALDTWTQHVGYGLPAYLTDFFKKRDLKPYTHPAVMTTDMQLAVNQILSCRLEGLPRDLYLEAKALELVALYLAFANDQNTSSPVTLSPRDIECVREAQHILITSMDSPPSLLELAHRVGLNDYKLKAGFRQAFGTTAFGYLREMRLQRAFDLLQTGIYNVTQTAQTVGYHNIGDFGIAFKRRFGMSPSAIRRAKKSVKR
ncbi:MAG: AraC family transcriptional regulator [Chloroflexota bacterium]